MSKKQIIKINENEFKALVTKIVNESVKRVLNEQMEEGLFGNLFGRKSKKQAKPVQQQEPVQQQAPVQQSRDVDYYAEKCAELQCQMRRIGDSSDPEYRQLSNQYNSYARDAKYVDPNGDFDFIKSRYLDRMGFHNIKPYNRGGYTSAHAGESYYGGRSSYDNMGR